jgi:hypothetical protein
LVFRLFSGEIALGKIKNLPGALSMVKLSTMGFNWNCLAHALIPVELVASEFTLHTISNNVVVVWSEYKTQMKIEKKGKNHSDSTGIILKQ